MFEMKIDEKKMEQIFLEEVKEKIKLLEKSYTFWDLDELSRRTCMSINNIKDKFFYDPKFPKYKIGGKWYMPAQECENFLLHWIKDQAE